MLPRERVIQLDKTQPSFEALTHSRAWKYELLRTNTMHHCTGIHPDATCQSQTCAETDLSPNLVLDSNSKVVVVLTRPPLVPECRPLGTMTVKVVRASNLWLSGMMNFINEVRAEVECCKRG